MKKKLHYVLFLVGLFYYGFAYSLQSPGSATPSSPPGDGGDGALVKDVPEMPLENWFLLMLLAMAIAFCYFKPILFLTSCKTVRKPNNLKQ
ncbi:hypothetical protein [Psychroflexus planctonicus]|uniref:Uncharacterized protein n=1 Tax=Psychroflexus planctonicus TaxID=1526575 RepID=A0ABQ1SH16_9FLAO|nr:hypothetical protein [Psychroflexus planctonicus]GGE33647.1 hypothetical protein GCM10010832_12280 [Psychroflexus planctonicus]